MPGSHVTVSPSRRRPTRALPNKQTAQKRKAQEISVFDHGVQRVAVPWMGAQAGASAWPEIKMSGPTQQGLPMTRTRSGRLATMPPPQQQPIDKGLLAADLVGASLQGLPMARSRSRGGQSLPPALPLQHSLSELVSLLDGVEEAVEAAAVPAMAPAAPAPVPQGLKMMRTRSSGLGRPSSSFGLPMEKSISDLLSDFM